MVNRFDELSQKAYAPGAGIPELNELWGNTFLLKEWVFIARGPADHPHPYVASRPDVCEGKHMLRAFTDAEKAHAFANENDLLEDGKVRLMSVPTTNIIHWTGQFAQHGVHGVWFNSDAQSYGYFAPLAQLQPMKEYIDQHWTRNPGDN